MRKTKEESLDVLRKNYSDFVNDSQKIEFFRTFVGDGDDLENLTLPETFFGR